MKKLFLKLLLLLAVSFIVCAAFRLLPVPYHHAVAHSNLMLLINKHAMLEKTDQPRMIFIGGSGVYYGLDCGRIRKELNHNAVNLGLYAGFGLKYMLEDAEQYIRKNDIIIIIPEHILLHSVQSYRMDKQAFITAAYLRPFEVFGYFSKEESIDLKYYIKANLFIAQDKAASTVMILSDMLRQGINPELNYFQYGNLYPDKEMDAYGTKITRNTDNAKIVKEKSAPLDDFNHLKTAVDELNSFGEYARKAGAKTYFIYSCFPDTEYAANKTVLAKTHDIMKREMKIKILSDPENYVFPESDFLDTVNHLNAEGKRLRTDKVIHDLKKELNIR